MPLALTIADWASAIAKSAQAATRTISMIAPTSLRRRMGMISLHLPKQAADYMVRAAGNQTIA
jgi:hypothetical protein